MTKEQLEAVAGDALKTYGDLAAVSKLNVETMLKATTTLTKGVEEIGHAWAAMAKRLVDAQMSSLHALLGARNIKDVVELHAGLTRTHIQTALSGSAKLSELAFRVASEAIQPISARVADSVRGTAKAA